MSERDRETVKWSGGQRQACLVEYKRYHGRRDGTEGHAGKRWRKGREADCDMKRDPP